MSDACANPDCGHPKNHHSAGRDFCIENLACSCLAFVADVNRPEPLKIDVPEYDYPEKRPPAVPDREGATEQLAVLLAAHAPGLGIRDMRDHCVCGWDGNPLDGETHRAHVAAVIVAAGWRKA